MKYQNKKSKLEFPGFITPKIKKDILEYLQHEKINIAFDNVKQISQKIINYYSDYNEYITDFKILREKFIAIWKKKEDVPQKPKKFYNYVCEKFLSIVEKDPYILDKYIERWFFTKKQIQSYEEKYTNLQNEIADTEDKIYKKRLYKYMHEQIHLKKMDMLEVIDLLYYHYYMKRNINPHKFDISTNNYFLMDFELKMKHPNIMTNKLLDDIEINEHQRLSNLFIDDKNDFLIEIRKLISLKDIIAKIKKRYKRHHLLNQRSSILERILDAFEKGDHEIFINISPLQIEGILNDICLEAGIEEESLKFKNISQKINLLNDQRPSILSYEYYAFEFPVLRNKIAHGNLLKEDNNVYSYILLLDLDDITSAIFNSTLKTQKKLNIIEEANSSQNFKKLIMLVNLQEEELNHFYEDENNLFGKLKIKLKNKINEIDSVKKEIENINSLKEIQKIIDGFKNYCKFNEINIDSKANIFRHLSEKKESLTES